MMRNLIFTTTSLAGLLLSLSVLAADDDAYKACLESNSGKSDKITVCDMQKLQSAIDARNKDLDDKYKAAKTELQKEQDDLNKKQQSTTPPPATGSSSASNSSSSSSSSNSSGSEGASQQGSSNSNTDNSNSSSNNGSSQSQSGNQSQQQQSGFGKKPSPTIQWY